MDYICEKCGQVINDGDIVFKPYDGKNACLCKQCAEKISNESNSSPEEIEVQAYSNALNNKKADAEKIINDKDQFEKFLRDMEEKLKTIPAVGNLLADVPLLISIVKSYIEGKYKEIPTGTIVAIIAALLYVLSPIDILPDFIPVVGFADDAAVVAFCVASIHSDLAKYKAWRDGTGELEA